MAHDDGRRSGRAEGDDHAPPAGPGAGGSQRPGADGRTSAHRPAYPAEGHRHRGNPGLVIAGAARAGRRYWLQILALAIPVSVVGSGLEIVIDHYVDPSDAVLSVGAS